eukprot:2993943-Pyramimonas_sp.AAC.1
MLQDTEIRAASQATDILPEPLNSATHADWAIEKEPATTEDVHYYMINWGLTALGLTRNQ